MNPRRALECFRVYPEHRALFYEARIYARVRDMQDAYAAEVRTSGAQTATGKRVGNFRKTLGAVMSSTEISFRKGTRRTSPNLGVILLCHAHRHAHVVAHEAAHAARFYLERMRVPLDAPATDERFAYIVGNIVQQIGRRAWR